MDKKALIENIGFNILRLIFLAIVTIVLWAVVRNLVVMYEDVSEAKAEVYANKMLYDKDGIIMYENDRVYPGVIDFNRFKGENIDKIMAVNINDESPCARLSLYMGARKFTPGEKPDYVIYWNQLWFDRLEPKTGGFIAFTGMGAPRLLRETVFVKLYKDNKISPATLELEVIVPK
jgi:hypothetical protein